MADLLELLYQNYQALKVRYHPDMPLAELEALTSDLRAHNEKFQKTIELVGSMGLEIKTEYTDAHAMSAEAYSVLYSHLLNVKSPKGNHVPSSPIKLLSHLFETHGTLIRWIDQLEDSGFKDLAINLPRIIVVGDENVGKSSVLESIAGVPIFPRAEGICTRLPFQMRMHHRTPEKMVKLFGHLTPENPASAQSATLVTFDDQPDKFLQSPDEIRSRVMEITKQKTGGKGVKDDIVVLNVYSSHVTDLTLIDLPGIITAGRPGEPDNIHEITLAMIQKYINSDDTIILAVIDARTSLVSSQALREVQRAKAQKRAVAVLTKVDLTTPRDKIDQKIMGTSADNVELPNGYIGVVNMDTEQNQGYTEEQYFKEKYPQLLQQGKVGVDALTRQLNTLLGRHIRDIWAPNTKKILQSKQTEVKRLVDNIGPAPPPTNAKSFFRDELDSFCTAFNAKLDGSQSDFCVSSTQEMFLLTNKAKKTGSNKTEVCLGLLRFADKYIEEMLKKCLDACKLSRFPTLCEKISILYRQLIIEPKRKCSELMTQFVEIDSTPIPAAAEQQCVVSDPSQPFCTICRETDAPDSGGSVVLHCSPTARHSFHLKCFLGLNKSNPTCPVCRAYFPSKLEKSSPMGGQVDPVMIFALKTIWRYLASEVKNKFTLTLESEFDEVDEEAASSFKEDPQATAQRQKYLKQMEVIRGTLIEIMRYAPTL